jgi:CheY-like chemotaxis protein
MKTILVLEDHVALMDVLRLILKPYRLLVAATPGQAQFLMEHDRHIDLLVADLSLPISSGLQVALHLRSAAPKLPVILMSGHRVSDWTSRDCADLAKLGSTSVVLLQKPFRAHLLANSVSELLVARKSQLAGTA